MPSFISIEQQVRVQRLKSLAHVGKIFQTVIWLPNISKSYLAIYLILAKYDLVCPTLLMSLAFCFSPLSHKLCS